MMEEEDFETHIREADPPWGSEDEEDENEEIMGPGTKDDPVPGRSKGRTIIYNLLSKWIRWSNGVSVI